MKVAIIGRGAAGSAAAYKAKIRKHDVVVFHHQSGATSLSSGAIDLFPFSWAKFLNPRAAFHELSRSNPDHPLIRAQLSFEDVQKDLLDWSRFLASGGVSMEADFDRGLFLLNHLGMPKWSIMSQRCIAAGRLDLLRGKKIGLIHVLGSPIIHPPVFLKNVYHLYPKGWQWTQVSVEPPSIESPPGHSFQTARLLDHAPAFSPWIEKIKAVVPKNIQALAFPAILGIDQAERNRTALENALGVPCFELVSSIESIPGMRLYRGINRALESLGVDVRQGKILNVDMDGEKSRVVYEVANAKGSPETLEFDRAIVASGRFIGGGFQMDERGPRESLVGRPINAKSDMGGDRDLKTDYLLTESLWKESVLDAHPVHLAGVRSDVTAMPILFAGSVEGSGGCEPRSLGMAASIVLGSRAGATL